MGLINRTHGTFNEPYAVRIFLKDSNEIALLSAKTINADQSQ
jgi:hypothetical protein